jgi:recombination protein RecA
LKDNPDLARDIERRLKELMGIGVPKVVEPAAETDAEVVDIDEPIELKPVDA